MITFNCLLWLYNLIHLALTVKFIVKLLGSTSTYFGPIEVNSTCLLTVHGKEKGNGKSRRIMCWLVITLSCLSFGLFWVLGLYARSRCFCGKLVLLTHLYELVFGFQNVTYHSFRTVFCRFSHFLYLQSRCLTILSISLPISHTHN